MTTRLKGSSILKVALLVTVALLTETSFAANSNASAVHFSQKQIINFVKTVTTELEFSKNWKSNFSNTAGSKLYCQSVVLGEGVRAGNPGLYTWFTCSAMHKLVAQSSTSKSIECTGFSSPVWIQPSSGSISYQTVSYSAQYSSFRATAPVQIKTLMDSTYSQLNVGQPRILIARATQSAPNDSHQNSICQ